MEIGILTFKRQGNGDLIISWRIGTTPFIVEVPHYVVQRLKAYL